MKRLKLFSCFFLLISAAFVYSACSTDGGGEEDPAKVADPGEMIASVDGQDWTSSQISVLIYNGQTYFIATGADGSQVVVSVKGTKAGKYTVTGSGSVSTDHVVSFSPANGGVANPTYSSTYVQETVAGEIVITEMDATNKTISGTFKSKMTRFVPETKTIEISGGSFSRIVYSDDPGSIPNNMFAAKVNGATFSATSISGDSRSGKVILTFISADNVVISLYFPLDAVKGTFDFGPIASTYYATYTSSPTGVFESRSGSVTIVSHDKTNKRLIGNFSFAGELVNVGGGALSVSDGTFDVSYK